MERMTPSNPYLRGECQSEEGSGPRIPTSAHVCGMYTDHPPPPTASSAWLSPSLEVFFPGILLNRSAAS